MPPATHTSSPLALPSIMACRSPLASAQERPVLELEPDVVTNDIFGAAIGKAKVPVAKIARSKGDTRRKTCRGRTAREQLLFEVRRRWVILYGLKIIRLGKERAFPALFVPQIMR